MIVMQDAKNRKKPPRMVLTIVGVARATANCISLSVSIE